jgi:hypothetical protein
MTTYRLRRTAAAIAVVLLGAGISDVLACSTPVFRYALENWRADPYQLTVRHSKPVPADLKTYLDNLGDYREGQAVPNVYVQFSQDSEAPAEGVVDVRFPQQPQGMAPLASVPLNKAAIQAVVTSPMREAVAKELLAGGTAVWLFLESGNARQDAEARKRLDNALEEIKGLLQLPPGYTEQFGDVEGEGQETRPPPISFPVLTLKRDDPDETFLVQSLLHTESDLKDLDEPMAFPVFGRGRALYALVGGGINRDIVAEACAFMTGACSCQVKSMNPGVDLLISANWDSVFADMYYQEEPPPALATVMPVEDKVQPEVLGSDESADLEDRTEPPTGEPVRDLQPEPEGTPETPVETPAGGRFTSLTWAVVGLLAFAVAGIAVATPILLRR